MRKLINWYYEFLKIVLTILMGVLLIPVSLQIFSRYVGFIPRYIWTEELARFCFIWIVLVGAMIAMREREHFLVDLLPTPKSQFGRLLSVLFVDLATAGVAFIFVFWGWPLVEFGLLQTSEMAELPMVYIYAAWPITGITWFIFLAEHVHDHIRDFRRRAL